MMSAEYQCMLHSSVGWKMQSGGGVWETDGKFSWKTQLQQTQLTDDLGDEHVLGRLGFYMQTKMYSLSVKVVRKKTKMCALFT